MNIHDLIMTATYQCEFVSQNEHETGRHRRQCGFGEFLRGGGRGGRPHRDGILAGRQSAEKGRGTETTEEAEGRSPLGLEFIQRILVSAEIADKITYPEC